LADIERNVVDRPNDIIAVLDSEVFDEVPNSNEVGRLLRGYG